ncbi:hypothetical protein ABH945_004667 [Paraburkholderia sp. GAS333]
MAHGNYLLIRIRSTEVTHRQKKEFLAHRFAGGFVAFVRAPSRVLASPLDGVMVVGPSRIFSGRLAANMPFKCSSNGAMKSKIQELGVN